MTQVLMRLVATVAVAAATTGVCAGVGEASQPAATTVGQPPVLVPAPTREGSWPRTLTDSAPAKAPVWSPQDIETARAVCRKVLHGVEAVVQPVEPFRHDGDCGAPAAMQLISIGRNPEIAVSPPIIVTCDMVAALARWTKAELQPLARRHLGAPVIRIETMSSYACRNAYGRKNSRLSEHGRANAIDIRGFTTAAGLQSAVLDDWGMTQRQIEAEVAVAKAAAAKAKALAAHGKAAPQSQTAATAPSSGQATNPGNSGLSTGTLASATASDKDSTPRPAFTTVIEGLPALGRRIPTLPLPRDTGFAFGEPSRLGGPKPQRSSATRVRVPTETDRARFHRALHESACRHFGTVLGPEANRAHENHYHFDMAERPLGSFCE